MKKFTLCIGLVGASILPSVAQITDSIQTGPSYTNDVYYSLENGFVKTEPNNNWQLAFSIGSFNVAVRANTTASSSGDGSVVIYEKAGTDTTVWNSFDTSGYATWPMPENSDEDWQTGALNNNAEGQFDYGWGFYDSDSHIIFGHRLYLAAIKSGGSTLFKKVWIVNKTLGTWNIRYADLDGSNEHTVAINSGDYAGKNFAYLSLVNNTVVDREPARTAWDFVLTRYKALQSDGTTYYPSTGILTNANVVTAEARGAEETTAELSAFIADTTENISEIGADWKQLNSSFQFYIVDSLCYFVKGNDGAFWKLVFTSFAGSSTGKTVFSKTKITQNTGLGSYAGTISNFTVYPNPARESLQILFDGSSATSTITLTDLSGKVVLSRKVKQNGAFNHHTISVGGIKTGLYLLHVTNGNNHSISKVVIE